MIGSEINQGEVYAFGTRKYESPRRGIVVDRDEVYNGDRGFFNGSVPPDHRVWRTDAFRPLPRARKQPRKKSGRFGVAIEYELVDSEWNPETNEWDRVDLGTVWVPYAASSREILRPWAEQAKINEEKAALERQRRAAAKRAEKLVRRRSEILRVMQDAGSTWRSEWHRDRDKRLRLEGRRRLVERIGEMVQTAIDDRTSYPSGVSVAYEIVDRLVEEYGLDVTKPLPDPIAALQGRAS